MAKKSPYELLIYLMSSLHKPLMYLACAIHKDPAARLQIMEANIYSAAIISILQIRSLHSQIPQRI